MKNTMTYLFVILLSSFAHAKNVDEGRYLSLYSGYGSLSSSLTGSGFNADLPGKSGLILGSEISYQTKDTDNQFTIKYDKITLDQDAPSGVTPSNISVSREEFRFLFSFLPFDSGSLQDLKLSVGYALLESGATSTSPNNVMTKQNSQGFVFGASHKFKLPSASAFTVTPGVLFYLPHRFSESQQTTGYNSNYVGLEAQVMAEYLFSDNLLMFAGVSYRSDKVTFGGSVDRGVTNGTDTRVYISMPVGLKIGF